MWSQRPNHSRQDRCARNPPLVSCRPLRTPEPPASPDRTFRPRPLPPARHDMSSESGHNRQPLPASRCARRPPPEASLPPTPNPPAHFAQIHWSRPCQQPEPGNCRVQRLCHAVSRAVIRRGTACTAGNRSHPPAPRRSLRHSPTAGSGPAPRPSRPRTPPRCRTPPAHCRSSRCDSDRCRPACCRDRPGSAPLCAAGNNPRS